MSDLRCTYRLQLLPHLDFQGARELVPYLRELGISHLYLSPAMQARSDSTHGYDVVDPTRLSQELGGESEFRALSNADLGIILDVVPNHMAASEEENKFWRDPLVRAKFFDVEWRSGNVRRFFDIGDLAGVRVEDPEVFAETHAKVLELIRDGTVDGIRIDHPDGLANPARYFERLREAGVEHVWVEKILADAERLRDWPIEGTTGYEFANSVTRLFNNPAAEEPFTALYQEFTGEDRAFETIAYEAKLEQARTTFQQEVDWLRTGLEDIDDQFDLPRSLASFPVYRSYVDPDSGAVDELDRQAITDAGLPARLSAILLLEERGHDAFVIRFQQTTPPVTAKGVEDTAFYRYSRLLCLNEVGGNPARFSLSLDEFHQQNIETAERFPHQLVATQTHDTKRSGDVRARLSALTNLPHEWRTHVTAWRRLNAPLRDGHAPDANEEYLIYQTLISAWPLETDRLNTFLEKALREAKTNTSWTSPNHKWEAEVRQFAQALYTHQPFLRTFLPFAKRVAEAGERIALAQTLLKLTVPGVPDIYQGDELWNYNLVDPDNRRPIDWNRSRGLLAELSKGAPPRRETAKLFLIWKTLQFRARHPDSFAGSYEPIDSGPGICTFRRADNVLVSVPLHPATTFDLPPGWRNALNAPTLGLTLAEPA
jgi:(1->4)-alpha-D-glucan 1-alpha-D-glucosylmutase